MREWAAKLWASVVTFSSPYDYNTHAVRRLQLKDESKPRNLKNGLRQATASTANQGGNCKTLLALC